jgi:hypothetical protein
VIASALAQSQGTPEVPLPWPQGALSVRWEVPRNDSIRALDVSSFELGTLTRERVIVVRDVTQEE